MASTTIGGVCTIVEIVLGTIVETGMIEAKIVEAAIGVGRGTLEVVFLVAVVISTVA